MMNFFFTCLMPLVVVVLGYSIASPPIVARASNNVLSFRTGAGGKQK